MSYITRGQAVKTNFSANGQILALDVSQLNFARFEFSGTYTLTGTFETSTDSTNGTDGTWFPLQAVMVNAPTMALSHGTTNATQAYEASVAGVTWVRIRLTAYTSAGTHRVGIFGVDSNVEPAPVTALAAGTAAIGSVDAKQLGTSSNGGTTTIVNSAASTNAAFVKAASGTLYGGAIHNATAADKFVRFYNKATAPTVGTDTPAIIVNVKANSSKEFSFGNIGVKFTTGIGHAITGGATVLDATAVAAGDVQLTYEWA